MTFYRQQESRQPIIKPTTTHVMGEPNTMVRNTPCKAACWESLHVLSSYCSYDGNRGISIVGLDAAAETVHERFIGLKFWTVDRSLHVQRLVGFVRRVRLPPCPNRVERT
jgi:hypothetical protein